MLTEQSSGLVKVAFFVEGMTEQQFVVKLLKELITAEKIAIVKTQMSGGTSRPVHVQIMEADSIDSNTKYYFLVADCNGDGTVKSYILDRRSQLMAAGYDGIIGLRDLYPLGIDDFGTLRRNLYYGVPQRGLPIKFTISVMEIESWFLGEENHYSAVDSRLTLERVASETGFSPISDNPECITEPARKLDEIYRLVGKRYAKSKNQVTRTVENLDFANVYFELPKRVKSLKNFIKRINEFL